MTSTAPVPATADESLPEPPAAPQPILEGSFAVFTPPGGSILLAWRRKGSNEDHHLPVPPMVVQMAAQAGGGSVEDVIAKLASGEF